MSHAYTEDQLVEQPAIGLFAELGWTTLSAMEESYGANGTLLRGTKGEVVLVSRLHAALERLNPALPSEAINASSISLNRPVIPRGETAVLSETRPVEAGIGFIERLAGILRKSLIASKFLFE
jgi:hypothetical protein